MRSVRTTFTLNCYVVLFVFVKLRTCSMVWIYFSTLPGLKPIRKCQNEFETNLRILAFRQVKLKFQFTIFPCSRQNWKNLWTNVITKCNRIFKPCFLLPTKIPCHENKWMLWSMETNGDWSSSEKVANDKWGSFFHNSLKSIWVTSVRKKDISRCGRMIGYAWISIKMVCFGSCRWCNCGQLPARVRDKWRFGVY